MQERKKKPDGKLTAQQCAIFDFHECLLERFLYISPVPVLGAIGKTVMVTWTRKGWAQPEKDKAR